MSGNLTLVPFGLQESTGELIDVHSATRGADCGCICPSCRTPLIARQGEQNTWHFAHESRGTDDQANAPCEYSFWVSIKLMARQLFRGATSLVVPSHKVYGSAGFHNLEREVTREQRVQLSDIEIESALCGTPVDVVARVPSNDDAASFQLGVSFDYPDRAGHAAADPSELGKAKAGLIEIDLTHVARLFADAPRQQGSAGYRELLRALLFDVATGKRWLFHPREKRKMAELRQALRELRASDDREPVIAAFPPQKARASHHTEISRYGCRACRLKWVLLTSPRVYCPRCLKENHVVKIGTGMPEELGTGASHWDLA